MKVGIKTNKDNYQYYIFRRAIHICWVVLAVCLIVKMFGGNYFCIVCDNARVVAFATWIDKHFISKYLLGLLSSGISYTFYYLAIMRRKWFTAKQAIFVYTEIAVIVALRILFQSYALICVAFDGLQFFVVPLVLCRKEFPRWVVPRIIVGFILTALFQALSMFIKNLSFHCFISNNTLICAIYMIDVYIMLCLYYMYCNNLQYRRIKGNMGLWANWFFGKSIAQLECMKDKRKKKIARLRAEIAEIDKAIAIEKAKDEVPTDAE